MTYLDTIQEHQLRGITYETFLIKGIVIWVHYIANINKQPLLFYQYKL